MTAMKAQSVVGFQQGVLKKAKIAAGHGDYLLGHGYGSSNADDLPEVVVTTALDDDTLDPLAVRKLLRGRKRILRERLPPRT